MVLSFLWDSRRYTSVLLVLRNIRQANLFARIGTECGLRLNLGDPEGRGVLTVVAGLSPLSDSHHESL